jgi:hypothetical protein
MSTSPDAARIAKAVASAKSAQDVADLLDDLADLHEAGAFHWENADLGSFLRGMSLATQMFSGEPTGDFRQILESGPWRTMAVVVAMGLTLDD